MPELEALRIKGVDVPSIVNDAFKAANKMRDAKGWFHANQLLDFA